MLLIRENTIKAGIRRKRPFFVSFGWIGELGWLEVSHSAFFNTLEQARAHQMQMTGDCFERNIHVLGSVVNRCRKDGTWYEVAGTGLPG